jgi:hypothetical protein
MRWRPETFEDLLNPPEQVWPKRGDRLLKSTDDWDKAITFSPYGFDRFVHLWSGYMRAGDALVDEAERDPTERHFLIYPILFNYRHALELAIKWTVEQYGGYVDIYLSADEKDHNLWKSWQLCKEVIVKIGGIGVGEDGFAGVEQIVKDFHELDRDGTAFRYSRTKTGATIELPQTNVDLAQIQRVMEGIDNFFTGADGLLDHNSGNADEPGAVW